MKKYGSCRSMNVRHKSMNILTYKRTPTAKHSKNNSAPRMSNNANSSTLKPAISGAAVMMMINRIANIVRSRFFRAFFKLSFTVVSPIEYFAPRFYAISSFGSQAEKFTQFTRTVPFGGNTEINIRGFLVFQCRPTAKCSRRLCLKFRSTLVNRQKKGRTELELATKFGSTPFFPGIDFGRWQPESVARA